MPVLLSEAGVPVWGLRWDFPSCAGSGAGGPGGGAGLRAAEIPAGAVGQPWEGVPAVPGCPLEDGGTDSDRGGPAGAGAEHEPGARAASVEDVYKRQGSGGDSGGAGGLPGGGAGSLRAGGQRCGGALSAAGIEKNRRLRVL